jgi:hypothetical protein
MKRISKIIHKTVLTLWYQPYTLSVFCGLFSLGQMVSSQKKAQYDMSKTTFGTQGQNAKKRDRVTGDNSLF